MIRDVTIESLDGHMVHASYYELPKPSGSCLLIHGITADRHERGLFDFLSEMLASKNISTLAIDLRGHGQSRMPISRLRLSGVYLDILAAWEFLGSSLAQRKLKRVIVGNSFGGGLAYLFGQTNSAATSVILTCPVMSYVADLCRVNQAWSTEVGSGNVTYGSKVLDSQIVQEMYAFDDLIERFPLQKKFHVVHGTSDSDVPFGESERFVERRKKFGKLHPLVGMDHSFSAPEGVPNRDALSRSNRRKAAEYIAALVARIS